MTVKFCIICMAITGSPPQKSDNLAMPITVAEQKESTQEAFEAGATITHRHVCNDGSPSSDPKKFGPLLEGQRRHCLKLIVQFSTSERSGAGRARGAMLSLRPDMASLSVGSNNFPTRVYENAPDLADWLAGETHHVTPEVEALALSHIFQVAAMLRSGRLHGKLFVVFVVGVKNAMSADKDVFDYYVATMSRLEPEVEWCAAGIGSHQLTLNEWSVAAGGHARTGLEDNFRLDRHTLAPSNAALVRRTAEIAARHARPIANFAKARAVLGLRVAA